MEKLKSLFQTPKKAALTIGCLLVALATLAAAMALAFRPADPSGSAIGGDAAASFAFADAGVDPVSAAGLSTRYGQEDGQFVYQVDFSAGGAQYRYLIDAATGAVVKKEKALAASQPPAGGMTPSKTLEEAREIALADAGVTGEEAVFSLDVLGEDNGIQVYQFQFRAGRARYEYGINANTGAVYSKVTEIYAEPTTPEPSAPADTPQPAPESAPLPTEFQPPASSQPAGSPAPTAAQLTLEDAKAAALADAGVDSADAVFTKTELDYEDGLQVYDVEFYTSTHEYEYEIDAATGRVYSKSAETFQPPSQTTPRPDGGYIGADQAKSAALDHAGLTADQVRLTKTAMDRDDGRMVYEIEFRYGGAEYEYKIDAQTGAVLEHELERH